MVNAANICEKERLLFTGDLDGVVALWKFDGESNDAFDAPMVLILILR